MKQSKRKELWGILNMTIFVNFISLLAGFLIPPLQEGYLITALVYNSLILGALTGWN